MSENKVTIGTAISKLREVRRDLTKRLDEIEDEIDELKRRHRESKKDSPKDPEKPKDPPKGEEPVKRKGSGLLIDEDEDEDEDEIEDSEK